jgi:iduronate 2-sulfatase
MTLCIPLIRRANPALVRRLAAVGVAWLVWGTVGFACASSGRLNVLFIVADDMNTELGCYGHEELKTPTLDQLCERGTRFDAAYCQAPLCNPSRVSFLSGQRPERTGVYALKTPTRAHLGNAIMLPQFFKQHGYYTVQTGKIFHTGEGFEDPPSWDVMIPEFGKQPFAPAVLKYGDPPGPVQHSIDWAILDMPDENTPDGIVARRAETFMREAVHEGRPFFLGVGFRRPHAPFAAPKEYFEMYPVEKTSPPPPAPSGYAETILPAALNHDWGPRALTDEEQRQLRAAYFACNTFVDAQTKVLLDAMNELDLWRNTIVVFLGDHGYHLGDHGGLWHKQTLFEESCRVPLIIYAPGMNGAGRASGQVVELVDLYPTLADLCGLTAPDGLDGASLRPLLEGDDRPVKAGAFTTASRSRIRLQSQQAAEYLGRSVRTDRWRYTEWDRGMRGVELYDHENDPEEFKNVADVAANKEIVEQLHALLDKPSDSAAGGQ